MHWSDSSRLMNPVLKGISSNALEVLPLKVGIVSWISECAFRLIFQRCVIFTSSSVGQLLAGSESFSPCTNNCTIWFGRHKNWLCYFTSPSSWSVKIHVYRKMVISLSIIWIDSAPFLSLEPELRIKIDLQRQVFIFFFFLSSSFLHEKAETNWMMSSGWEKNQYPWQI